MKKILFLILALTACDDTQTEKEPSPFQMECEEVGDLIRCENEEAICYLSHVHSGNAISCVWKDQE